MSGTLASGRYIAQTLRVIRQQGARMLAAAPWSFGLFILTLPFAMAVPRFGGSVRYLFFALALLNLLALARTTYAWHRTIVLADAMDSRGVQQTEAEAKHLALLTLFIAVPVLILRATEDIPILIYFAMDGASDARFFIALFLAMAAVWGPMLYAGASFALSLPSAAVSGKYGFRALRIAMRVKRWPLVLALLMLTALVGFAKSAMREVVRYATASGVAYTVLFVVLSIVMIVFVTAMFAVAYRETVDAVDGGAA